MTANVGCSPDLHARCCAPLGRFIFLCKFTASWYSCLNCCRQQGVCLCFFFFKPTISVIVFYRLYLHLANRQADVPHLSVTHSRMCLCRHIYTEHLNKLIENYFFSNFKLENILILIEICHTIRCVSRSYRLIHWSCCDRNGWCGTLESLPPLVSVWCKAQSSVCSYISNSFVWHQNDQIFQTPTECWLITL